MNKGSSQGTRKNTALQEDYIPIDERSMLDLMKFTLDYSRQLNFYGLQNTVSANWEPFLLHDPAFVLAKIATLDIQKFELTRNDLFFSEGASNEPEFIVKSIHEISEIISEWERLISRAAYRGIVSGEIENLKKYAENLSLSLAANEQDKNKLKLIHDNLLGSVTFVRDLASKTFEKEIHENKDHSPHIGLLLSFFKLLKNVQLDLNELTRKHLDYYYLDILQQKKKKLSPGSAILGLQLHQGMNEFVIPEGEKCEFVFEGNQKLTFRTSTGLQLNKAEISDIITLYKSENYPFYDEYDENDFSYNIIYDADIQKEGIRQMRADFSGNREFPATFGEEQLHSDAEEKSIRLSKIGILLSSPTLILEQGRQEIILTFQFSPSSFAKTIRKLDGLIYQEIREELDQTEIDEESAVFIRIRERVKRDFFDDAFKLSITGENGWNEITSFKVSTGKMSEPALAFEINLNRHQNKLVSYDQTIHQAEYRSDWPCIKIELNNDARYHPYQVLRHAVIEQIMIKANVWDVSNLYLANSTGNLDHSVPFMPFGPVPDLGSFLQIQNPVILQKNLSELEFSINWSGLPQNQYGFENHYQAYPGKIGNDSFKMNIAQTRNSSMQAGTPDQQEENLFKTRNDKTENETRIKLNPDLFVFKNQIDQTAKKPDESAHSVFMVLTNPEIAFGHQAFTKLYADAAIHNSRFKRRQLELPNQPYTPVMESLTVDYSNTAREVMHRKQNEKTSDISLIHLYPFGHVQVFPGPVKSESFFLPQIEHKGNLFISLKQIKPGDIVSIGFEFIHAEYIHSVINVPEVHWEYLSNNEWLQLGEFLLEDTTTGLVKSGIVKIEIPYSIQFDNTRLSPGKFWLRAAYDGTEILNSRIKNVFAQAVSVISDPSEAEPPEGIEATRKLDKISFPGLKGIGKISGPFALIINPRCENEDSFYNRVSEQLRHKNRAVSNWDVERIILDKFKQIEKVRVFGRNNRSGELVKGSTMQIVLIPKNKIGTTTNTSKNKVDYPTLIEVKNYISKLVSPYVKVEVSNPVYEKLKVRCQVKFNDFQKRGSLRNTLNNELINYLSPDLETIFQGKGFDESFSKTEILNFIESRPYVDYVTQFSVLQLVEVQGKYKIIDTARKIEIKQLHTISAYAILTSANQHQIEVIQEEKYAQPEKSGVGDLSIESDFVIGNDSLK